MTGQAGPWPPALPSQQSQARGRRSRRDSCDSPAACGAGLAQLMPVHAAASCFLRLWQSWITLATLLPVIFTPPGLAYPKPLAAQLCSLGLSLRAGEKSPALLVAPSQTYPQAGGIFQLALLTCAQEGFLALNLHPLLPGFPLPLPFHFNHLPGWGGV